MNEIRVVATGLGGGCRDDLVQAIAGEGWTFDMVADLDALASLAVSGACHLAVIVSHDPHELPRQTVRTLMALQSDLSVIFLVSEDYDVAQCGPLIGATSDQIHRLSTPTTDLVEVFRHELQSVLSNQPQYTIMCVDDDDDFLASLKTFLCARLRKHSSRFALNFEFFADPEEALSEIKDAAPDYPAVVISDQIMPEMEGIELLKHVKGICPDSRRVLLIGHAALESAVSAINEHVLDKYFFKPIEDPVDFTSNIRHLVLEYHLHTRTNKQRNRLMSQFELIRTISAAKSIDQALSVAMEYLQEQVRPQRAVIALAQDDDWTIRAGLGLPEELSIGTKVGEYDVVQQVIQRHWPVVTRGENNFASDWMTKPFASASLIALPLLWGNTVSGVMLVADPVDDGVFTREEKVLVSFVADVTAMTVSSFEDRRALEDVYLGTMATLMETVEAKDIYTRGHTDRVKELAIAFAKHLGIRGEQLQNIKRAALLHDIGKIAVPDRIILKPGALDAEEYATVQEHSAKADQILQHLRFLDPVRIIARAHHERYDGAGYPDGLCGEEIPLGARVLGIVDSFDAMTSARPYREAMESSDALAEIEVNAGKQFDPKLVVAFLDMMRKTQTGEHDLAVQTELTF